MLEKLAKQTAVYGISTIVVRFLSYLLTPYYTRVFGQETYGVVTDIYALIPLALTLLTMGMESSYFRFSAKAEEAGGDVKAAKRRLFATTWGVTSLAAAVFFLATAFFRDGIARMMGEAYVAHPEYVVWVGLIILFDVWACIPFSRLREQGRAMTFVGLKAMNVVLNVALAFGFGAAGLFATDFGVGWVFVANLIASVVTWLAILGTADRTVPKINWALLAAIFAYSLPLLVGGLAGTANEFIDRQLIKYLVPEGAMAQLGIYGAITKIAVVMMLFYQMYRLAAEPFFLSNFRKSDFVAMNAAALKYYVMASMLIFLGIALFRDVFALIVGRSFREGIFILPVVLGANVLTGVWLNPLVLVQARGAHVAGHRRHGCGTGRHRRFRVLAHPAVGLLRGRVGAPGERNGDGRRQLVAQPPLLPDALRLAAHRRIRRRGARGFRRLRGFDRLCGQYVCKLCV